MNRTISLIATSTLAIGLQTACTQNTSDLDTPDDQSAHISSTSEALSPDDITVPVAAVRRGTTGFHALYRGASSGLFEKRLVDGVYSNYSLGNVLTSAPTAHSRDPDGSQGDIDLAARGASGNVIYRRRTIINWQLWEDWGAPAAATDGIIGRPIVASTSSANSATVFVRASPNGAIYARNASSSWQYLNGATNSEISITQCSEDTALIAVRGTDNALYYSWVDLTGAAPQVSSWIYAGGNITAAPSGVCGHIGYGDLQQFEFYIYVRDTNGALERFNIGPNNYSIIGGHFNGAPYAQAWDGWEIAVAVSGAVWNEVSGWHQLPYLIGTPSLLSMPNIGFDVFADNLGSNLERSTMRRTYTFPNGLPYAIDNWSNWTVFTDTSLL